MSSGTFSWLTNEEIMRGLSEGYVIVGDAPPPIRFETEDDEMLEQFGDSIRAQKGIPCDNQPPDLQGITSMLRMIQTSDDEDDKEVTANGVEPSDCVIAISKPSLLNPNVQEFVPKCASSSVSPSNIREDKVCTEENYFNGVHNGTDKPRVENKHLDSVKTDDNVNIVLKLKNEIVDASKSDSFDVKKRKNVAISSLLKFYATDQAKKTEPLKLITPDFYEHIVETPKNVENSKTQSLNASPNKTNLTMNRSGSAVQSEPAICNEKEINLKSIHSDDTIKKSIDKVNQWLSEPVEKKTSKICLGPIEFKKKEPSTSKSNTHSKQTEEAKISTPNKPSQYKPSTYAEDLGKKYMAQNKVKESQKVNTWDDLYSILKERDETLLKKAQNQAKVCSNSEVAES